MNYKFKRLFIAFLVAIAILGYSFPLFMTTGTSMLPTLFDNDWIIGTRFFTPDRGDVVVCLIHDSNGELVRAVKRVIAVGGDEIEITQDSVTVNDIQLEEDYTYDKVNGTTFAGTVEEGQYFLLGDNRVVSYDSRIVGGVQREYILAKIIYDLSGSYTVR